MIAVHFITILVNLKEKYCNLLLTNNQKLGMSLSFLVTLT